MKLESLDNCILSIGTYPNFKYNANGGGGNIIETKLKGKQLYSLQFDRNNFKIPSLNWRTTKLFNIPLPPLLNIEIETTRLDGTLNLNNGNVSLNFEASFKFSIWPNILAPDLIVKTCLNTGRVSKQNKLWEGMSIQQDGQAILVGIAKVPRTNNNLLNAFLDLPNEALAVLRCRFIREV